MSVLRSELFTNADVATVTKLENCALGLPNEVMSHFDLGANGEHIKRIQRALENIQKRETTLAIPSFKISGVYDDAFAKAVEAYKTKRDIRNHANRIDSIVGLKTIRNLDHDQFPNEPPPAKADIKVVAADIKKELAHDDDRDLEFLARLFEDDRISDTGTGNALVNRLNAILDASSDGSNNGVTHFSGIFAGVTDLGFRKAFKDPFPGKSDNQVGHFTTAVDMGFRPQRTVALVPKAIRDLIDPGTGFPVEQIICMRLIVGHEQVADDSTLAFERQALSPNEKEVRQFFDATGAVSASPFQSLGPSRILLAPIRVGTGQGNSFQDLHLSLFGFKFGTMIRIGTMDSRGDAAEWIRTNLGTKLPPDPIPPGPPTG